MENVMESLVYMTYDGKVQVDLDLLFVVAWNKLMEEEGYGNKIFLNNKEFFKNSFNNPYDVAWAVSYGNYRWADDYAYFNREGHLMSFSRLDDKNSPIDLEKIDIAHLIDGLKRWQKNDKKRYVVNNIPRAIHDALQEE